MSKSVTANAALNVGREAKKLGYKSRMHTPELAEFRAWFDEEWTKGGKTLNTLYKIGCKKFPKVKIPAQTTLKNYVAKYYEHPTIEIKGYKPDYVKYLEEFDVYLKLIELAKDARGMFDKTRDRNVVLTTQKREGTSGEWYERYRQTLKDIFEIEIKLGIRTGIFQPTTLQNNTFNIGGKSNEPGAAIDVDKIIDIFEDREKIDAWKHSVRQLAIERNQQVFGTDKPS